MATEDECPEGFEKIPRNMLFGSEHKAFLIIRRGKNVDPVGEIRIVYSDDMQPDEGFTRVIPPIYSDAASSSKSISLSFSTVSKGRKPTIMQHFNFSSAPLYTTFPCSLSLSFTRLIYFFISFFIYNPSHSS